MDWNGDNWIIKQIIPAPPGLRAVYFVDEKTCYEPVHFLALCALLIGPGSEEVAAFSFDSTGNAWPVEETENYLGLHDISRGEVEWTSEIELLKRRRAREK